MLKEKFKFCLILKLRTLIANDKYHVTLTFFKMSLMFHRRMKVKWIITKTSGGRKYFGGDLKNNWQKDLAFLTPSRKHKISSWTFFAQIWPILTCLLYSSSFSIHMYSAKGLASPSLCPFTTFSSFPCPLPPPGVFATSGLLISAGSGCVNSTKTDALTLHTWAWTNSVKNSNTVYCTKLKG